LAALSIAYGQPELLLQCSSILICEQRHDESINPPDNQRRLNECAMRLIDGDQLNWWSSSLINMHILCAFDIMNTNNCESSITSSSDNRRLYGSIACDGAYIYILNCDGLFKLGSGFGETIIGRQYASNSIIRSSRGVSLTVCNGSLYLRRRQSSKIWVIDLDCLREIGEIILNSNVGNGGAIVCDGQCFYLANIDNSSNLVITQLDDTFNIIDDTKQRQRYRIVDLCYTIFGDQSILSITNIPQHLLSQTTDIQIAKEFAVLLARTGKVYYSGNASRIGLHDTNGVWMELVLSESIVSINIGNIDASIETIVLRSGSGNIWIVGVSPLDIRASPAHRQLPSSNNAKLRRLHMSVKRKCVSIAVGNGCIVYVTDNGRVYATGRHTMHCHSESGLVFGLEHVHIASIACGKTHTVAISRHGHVYTWGLNNLNQCGRQEV
jgi:E3 ubiquitin-protein ligase MYCBP2